MPSISGKVRWAVVGLGQIAQVAVLPAFRHAAENSELVALVSGDPIKCQKLSKRYRLAHAYSYEQYSACLHSGEVDAVFIALPNHMHCEFSVHALKAGVHVLCEKPLAVTESECRQMIDAAIKYDRRLMVAYRLHFDEATLAAIAKIKAGEIGEPRFLSSEFALQVPAGNVRTHADKGGGTLYDIGIYCVNAARMFFGDEPWQVLAASVTGTGPRFSEVDEMTSAVLRFSGGRLATFTSSFGAANLSTCRIVGTEGNLRIEPAYGYADKLVHHLSKEGNTQKTVFPKRDQFAQELVYFSNAVLAGRRPEPSGEEGLADVRVIEALLRSAREGCPVDLPPPAPSRSRPALA